MSERAARDREMHVLAVIVLIAIALGYLVTACYMAGKLQPEPVKSEGR